MAGDFRPNGDEETGGERLNRIERALHLMLDDHIRFREEHKLLLSSQVLMQGGLESLRGEVQALARVVGVLASHVDTMRENFDLRLKRLEN
jgi:hypothetical protein